MRKLLIGLCVVAQLAVLGFMVYGRESVVQTGERIYLRTAPIDPRDPFRGDFVRLQYAMNHASNLEHQWFNSDDSPTAGEKVYAVLQDSIGSVQQVQYITDKKPKSGLFIRGRVQRQWLDSRIQTGRFSQINFKFGIEQLFVEQGAGIEIEDKQGLRGGLQVPMEVEVSVGKNGVAVITDYRWSPLGVELSFIANDNLNENEGSNGGDGDGDGGEAEGVEALNDTVRDIQRENELINSTIKITVENVSDEPVVLNNPGNDCGFVVEPSRTLYSAYKQASAECAGELEPYFITLESGEVYVLSIDLDDPRWYIQNEFEEAFNMRILNDSEFFRIVYRSPNNTDASTNEAIWIGELPSRAFNSRGSID